MANSLIIILVELSFTIAMATGSISGFIHNWTFHASGLESLNIALPFHNYCNDLTAPAKNFGSS